MKKTLVLFTIVGVLIGVAMMIYFYGPRQTTTFDSKTEVFTSPYITEFGIPTPSSIPNGIGVDKKGNVWFVENASDILAMFDTTSNLFTEYKIPSDVSEVWSLDFDTYGNIWFTDTSDRIWKFDIINEQFRSYDVPTKGSHPTDLVIDIDGKIWITQMRNNYSDEGDRIAVFDPSKESFMEYKLAERSGPAGLVVDNGNLWIAQTYAHNVAKFNKHDFSYKQFSAFQSIVSPIGIAVDKEGTIWFAQHGASKISNFVESNESRFEFTTSPSTEFPITTPYWILIDSKQNIWFNIHSTNKIGKFIKANNTLIEYKIPSERDELINVLTIALDQDDNLWFTEWSRSRIGFVNSTIPVPFTIDVSPDFVSVDAGNGFSVDVTVTPNRSGEVRNIFFNASSTITPTGEFINSTVTFEPESISLDSANKSKLIIQTDPELTSGIYSITVSASDGLITYSRIVTVKVL